MIRRLARLFVIKNRIEAYAIIYALSVGAVARGFHYLGTYPDGRGYILFAGCTAAVFMAGAKLLDATRPTAYRSMSISRVVARARRQ